MSQGYKIVIKDPDGETFNELYQICIAKKPEKAVITNDVGKIIALQG